MILEYLKALSLIFVAEMGDKTQILAMTFAMQYPVASILTGVGIGAFFNHGIAIALGALLLNLIPVEMMQILAGALFVFFAFKSLSVEEEDEEEGQIKRYGPVLTVALAFFIGELGDKTQLAALGLSTDAIHPFVILLGTTSGMMLTSLVGIVVGRKLGKKIREDKLKIAAFFIFIVFGVQKLYVSFFSDMQILYFGVFMLMLIASGIWAITRFRSTYAVLEDTLYMRRVTALKELKDKGKSISEAMCKSCGRCDGTNCLVGYAKDVLATDQIKMKDHSILLNKSFDKEKAQQMLEEIQQYDDKYDQDEVIDEIRKIMEMIA